MPKRTAERAECEIRDIAGVFVRLRYDFLQQQIARWTATLRDSSSVAGLRTVAMPPGALSTPSKS